MISNGIKRGDRVLCIQSISILGHEVKKGSIFLVENVDTFLRGGNRVIGKKTSTVYIMSIQIQVGDDKYWTDSEHFILLPDMKLVKRLKEEVDIINSMFRDD